MNDYYIIPKKIDGKTRLVIVNALRRVISDANRHGYKSARSAEAALYWLKKNDGAKILQGQYKQGAEHYRNMKHLDSI